jgi:hypothetical protein
MVRPPPVPTQAGQGDFRSLLDMSEARSRCEAYRSHAGGFAALREINAPAGVTEADEPLCA